MLRVITRSSGKIPLEHFEPVTLVTPPGVEQPQAQNTTPKLQDVIAAVRPNPSAAECRELEELLTEY
jgi:hypothetical protein